MFRQGLQSKFHDFHVRLRSDMPVIGFCVVLIAVVWLFVHWEIATDRQATISQIVTTNDKLALAFEDHTSHALLRVDKTLQFIKTDFEANGAVTPSIRRLVRIQTDDALFNQSVVTDAAGNPIVSAVESTLNISKAPQFQAHVNIDTGKFFIGAPRRGLISGKDSLHVSRRLNHPDGSFAGMVSVAVNPAYFTNFYQAMELGTGHVVTLVGLDKVVRANQQDGKSTVASLESLFAAIEKSKEGNFSWGGQGSVPLHYYSYRVLKEVPLVVMVGVSGETAMLRFRDRRDSYFVVATVVSILILLYSTLLLGGALKQRLSQARYRALMEQSFEALAVVDIETREVVEVNRKFSELLGYSLPEDAPLKVDRFVVDTQSNLDLIYGSILRNQRVMPVEPRIFRHKNGSLVYVERAGTVIDIGDRDCYLASFRDMTAERRRQSEISRDVELAKQVQRQLLPKLPESPHATVRTFYYPVNIVSGDSYSLEWCYGGTLLRGFLVDVSGHGLGTALQTASIISLLREASASTLPLVEQLVQVNERAAKYFTDGTYAAMLGFELDLSQQELRYVGAGITQFYVNGKKRETPGMFVGIWGDAEFTAGAIPVASGDCFCFLTDGFTDELDRMENQDFWGPDRKNFDAHLAGLERLAASGSLRDDATGVCVRVH